MRRFLNRLRKTLLCTFRKLFEALNATICWSVLHKLLTIQKYGISAFTGKKINVPRPKLIENERNEVLKNFHFFQKKSIFLQILKIPWKNISRSCFFWKNWFNFKTVYNRCKSLSEDSEGIVRKLRPHFERFCDFKCDNSIICEIVAFRS